MRTQDVIRLTPVDQFLYFIRERHEVHLRRQAGLPRPWTDDEILQNNFFTNPYRENDKTTVWFRENVRDPLRNDPSVLVATAAFRWFNYIATGEALMNGPTNLLVQWNEAEAIERLSPLPKIFTGAFMVNSPPGRPKLPEICRRITDVAKSVLLPRRAEHWKTMQEAHTEFLRFEGLGGFGAYELVCDLRYTRFLDNATDKFMWCNPGPGAIRGFYRVFGRDLPTKSNATCPPVPRDWEQKTRWLLSLVQRELSDMPPFEMREVEMTLCEVDKLIRILRGEGRSKRKFDGRGSMESHKPTSA